MNHEQLKALLKARADVKLPADYSQNLLRALHEKQRAVLLQKPLWKLALERFRTFWSEHSLSTPAYALGWAAIFAAGLAAILLFKPVGESTTMVRQTAPALSPIQSPVDALPVHFENQQK